MKAAAAGGNTKDAAALALMSTSVKAFTVHFRSVVRRVAAFQVWHRFLLLADRPVTAAEPEARGSLVFRFEVIRVDCGLNHLKKAGLIDAGLLNNCLGAVEVVVAGHSY